MAQFYGNNDPRAIDELLGKLPENTCVTTELEDFWTLYFDSSSTIATGGIGVVLISPDDHTTTISHKLSFTCTNNVAEYEAFLTGLAIAKNMGVQILKVMGDSNLVVRQLVVNFL